MGARDRELIKAFPWSQFPSPRVPNMSKVTPQNMKDLQFVDEQFGTPADFDVFLQGVIDSQESLLTGRVGTTVFNSTDPVIAGQVKAASISMVAAELLQRRINRLSGNIDADTGALIRTLHTARKEYLADAEEKIARVVTCGSAPDSGGFSGGVWTSDHYRDNP